MFIFNCGLYTKELRISTARKHRNEHEQLVINLDKSIFHNNDQIKVMNYVVNWALSSLQRESLEITLQIPLHYRFNQ